MKLLLDTHTFLWLVEGNPKLTSAANAALADTQNELFFSVASIWEMVIKVTSGKLALSNPLYVYVDHWMRTYQIQGIEVSKTHAFAVSKLPLLHRDPFDRMLIAQATCEQMTLVSSDSQIAAYTVPILW